MAITVSNIINSGNKANTTVFTQAYTPPVNTKFVVAILTGWDSSLTDIVGDGINTNIILTFGGIDPYSSQFSYTSSALVYMVVFNSFTTEVSSNFVVDFAGTVTDAQVTLISLVSTNNCLIDNTVVGGSATSNTRTLTKSTSQTSGVLVGGISIATAAIGNLSVTTGVELTGSEVDMGSQVAGAAYANISGGAATIVWTATTSVFSVIHGMLFYENLTPSSIIVKVWNGSTWTTGVLKYWDGSIWTTKTPKVWNGSSWT